MSAWLCVALLLAQPSSGERIWLDSTSGDLTAEQWVEVEGLLRAGLRRRALEVSRDREPPATLVVQIRRIQNEYFVFAASGPAVAGSGVTMSRRIAVSSIPEGALSLVLAQTAEELIGSALAPHATPTPAPPTALELPPPLSTRDEPRAPPLPWRLTVEALASVDVFGGGAVALTGGASASAQLGSVGLSLSAGGGGLAPHRSSSGLLSGATVWVALGPQVEVLRVGAFRLDALATARAQWVRAQGTEPSEGLLAASGEGWAVSMLGGVAPGVELTDWVHVRLGLSLGGVLRQVTFMADQRRVLALSGVCGNASLALGGHW